MRRLVNKESPDAAAAVQVKKQGLRRLGKGQASET